MADQQLRREIQMLGEMLGTVLREQAGIDAFNLVEETRALAKARRKGDRESGRRLAERIASLSNGQIESLIQSLSVFFDLANLAEDRHRVRVISSRQRNTTTAGVDGIREVVALLSDSGLSAGDVQALLQRLTIEFVFTAHPTEAKRRSIREKIRAMRDCLYEMDGQDTSSQERTRLIERLKAELTGIWQTDFVRFRRPSVLEELDRSLYFASNLWQVTPTLYRNLAEELQARYPGHSFTIPPFLRFGTWIGGDRDGHPHVTAEVTRQSLAALRRDAITRHIDKARSTRRHLSMSMRKNHVARELLEHIEQAIKRWPALHNITSHLSESEPYRRWLRVVQWRLERSLEATFPGSLPDGAYESSQAFAGDLRLMQRSLEANQGARLARTYLDDWICQAEVFGFHLMRMDVRQESSWYRRVLDEIFALCGHPGYAQMEEPERQRVLSQIPPAINFNRSALSDEATETLSLFLLLASVAAMSGDESLGAQIISMTHQPSDVLAVLWLSRWAAQQEGLPERRLPMPIAPLFETIDDLNNAGNMLDSMLRNQTYLEHVHSMGSKQIVMIGYSDSTKDGGYLAACWQLHDAQIRVHQIAAKHGVQVVFFHGRGGSLGRGGGPAARSILSLPPETMAAGLRVTEQGEVLSERYDDPQVAKRHLEQVLGAVLACTSGAIRQERPVPSRQTLLQSMAARSRQAYRSLVESDGFIAYFEQATPITQIEQLPIGSRPSRRRSERSLATLRAIPWVFSWTQSRHMIPAWYGLGSALKEALQNGAEPELRTLWENDRFFRATIDNACLALAKADIDIARLHASLVEDAASRRAIWNQIAQEFAATRSALLRLTGKRQLLADIPWLKRSIEVRNPYVDPLNFIQVELFRRFRTVAENQHESDRLAHLIRLSIQGIAGGLRTTG